MFDFAHSEDILSLVYLYAEKFLKAGEFEEIKEVLSMTKLGKMLVEEGENRGIEKNKIANAKALLDVLGYVNGNPR